MASLKHKLRLSVIIVTLNRSAMLKDALASIAGQTRLPDEVIVVDNNSSDNTKEVAMVFNGKLNIKYVLEKTRGIPFARNAGIANALGEIIAFTDDDCVADKEWLHYLELPFLRDPSIGIVGGEIIACRTKGTLVEEYCIAFGLMRIDASLQQKKTPYSWRLFATANFAIRKEALAEIGQFDINCNTGEDVDLCMRLARTKWKLFFESRALIRHKHRTTLIALLMQQYGYAKYHPYVLKKHYPKRLTILYPSIRHPGFSFRRLSKFFGLRFPTHITLFLTPFYIWNIFLALGIFCALMKLYLAAIILFAGWFLLWAYLNFRYLVSSDRQKIGRYIAYSYISYLLNWVYAIGAFVGGLRVGIIYLGNTRYKPPQE